MKAYFLNSQLLILNYAPLLPLIKEFILIFVTENPKH